MRETDEFGFSSTSDNIDIHDHATWLALLGTIKAGITIKLLGGGFQLTLRLSPAAETKTVRLSFGDKSTRCIWRIKMLHA